MSPAFRSMLTCNRTDFARGLIPVSHFLPLTWSHFILGGDYTFLFVRGQQQIHGHQGARDSPGDQRWLKSVSYHFSLQPPSFSANQGPIYSVSLPQSKELWELCQLCSLRYHLGFCRDGRIQGTHRTGLSLSRCHGQMPDMDLYINIYI